MNARLKEIFSNLDECQTFADVGCDHGYVAAAMLKSGKCQRAIISDVSDKCLLKAELLLEDYIKNGTVKSVVSDGFEKVGDCDLALVAGMGGELIVSIIQKAERLPDKLVLQPMKNVDKVRIECVNSGYKIKKDYVFKAGGKFYDLLVLEKGKDVLTEQEIAFGRTNLKENGLAFKERVALQIKKYEKFVCGKGVNEQTKAEMLSQIKILSKYV